MSEKWDDFENWKNGHNAKGIAFGKGQFKSKNKIA